MKKDRPSVKGFLRASLTENQPQRCLPGLAVTSSALLVRETKSKLKHSKIIFQESCRRTIIISTDPLCESKVLRNGLSGTYRPQSLPADGASSCFSGRKGGKKPPATQELKAGGSEQPAVCKNKEQKDQGNWGPQPGKEAWHPRMKQKNKLKEKFCINIVEKGPATVSKPLGLGVSSMPGTIFINQQVYLKNSP